MAYIIKNTSGLINTRLTDVGRRNLSQGTFNISYFQIGDTIEYGYTVNGRNPIFEDEYFSSFQTGWSVPVGKAYISYTTDKFLYTQEQGNKKSYLTEKSFEGGYQYIWEQKSVPAVYDEGEYPHWYNPYGVIRFSQYETWKGIVDWAVAIYTMPKINN